jgi:Dolichyl-phosphate-mannose-protein mannosyltransferase
MHLLRRYRIPALFCALAVLLCELIAHPYTTMGVSDDGPYILMAHTLAITGHIVYNGWGAAMMVPQLYIGAAFIKLFGFSFTIVRMSTVLVAMVMAFVLQRTLVAANISERNAAIGTLALVLSPLYLMLSATFMSDIFGLFAIVLCLYGCLRALQSTNGRTTIAWLLFAIAANALFGTSRQIAWLGILVMVPSTLWLLRTRRRVLLTGAAITLAGFLFILVCMHWLKHQPYIVPVPLRVTGFPIVHAIGQLIFLFLDVPFLLLPIAALFLLQIRKLPPHTIAIFCALLFGYLFLAIYPSHLRGDFAFLLEPTLGDWVTVYGGYEYIPKGFAPRFLPWSIQALLTILSIGGIFGLIRSLYLTRGTQLAHTSSRNPAWKQLAVLLTPFTIAYSLLLISAAATTRLLFDRYALGLLVLVLICLVRYYQERINVWLPSASLLLVLIMATYGIAVTYNTFSLYRARVALSTELHANGIPDTSVDYGWEYNLLTELHSNDHINDFRIVIPTNAYVLVPTFPAGTCPMFWYEKNPHIHPLYGVSFDPNACYGPAPFAPVHYSRWPYRTPGTLYAVRYTPPSKP